MAAMGQYSQIYNTPAWRRVRLAVLERDGHLCQLRGEKCTVDATEVDHIVRPTDGGGAYEPENLRSSCATCNRSRGGKIGAHLTNARWSTAGVKPSREW